MNFNSFSSKSTCLVIFSEPFEVFLCVGVMFTHWRERGGALSDDNDRRQAHSLKRGKTEHAT